MSNLLPSAYQEVEYIESSGTQYINLGKIYTGKEFGIEIDFSLNQTKDFQNLWCCRTDGLFNTRTCFVTRLTGFRNDQYYQQNLMSILELNTRYNVKSLSDSFSLNNTILANYIKEYNSSEINDDFWLIGAHPDTGVGTLTYPFYGSLYKCKIYNGNETIMNLVPCYRKLDNKPGIYDIINNRFYVNSASSGDFTVGPDIIEEKEIIKKPEVNWSDSMEQTFEYYEVDPNTWKDIKPLNMVKKSTIKRDDGTDTLGSATIDINDTLGECYVRIYLIIRQNGGIFKITLGTFLVQTPSSSYDGKNRNVSMDAYTPLLELKENPPPLGYALLKNENIMRQAYMVVRDNCRAPVVETVSNETLRDNFVAEPDENWLSFIRDLIDQAKYKFYLDEEGRILFAPKQKLDELQPVWTYNDDNSSILYPEVSMQHDLYGIPNVVEVVCSTGVREYTARVVNDDPNSPTSTVNRGREILHRETDPNLPGFPSEEQIDEYAKNLLETLSSVEYEVTYTHGYCPVRVGDAVRLNYKRAGLEGIKAKVISQSIKCENGCSVSETAVFTKKLWN